MGPEYMKYTSKGLHGRIFLRFLRAFELIRLLFELTVRLESPITLPNHRYEWYCSALKYWKECHDIRIWIKKMQSKWMNNSLPMAVWTILLSSKSIMMIIIIISLRITLQSISLENDRASQSWWRKKCHIQSKLNQIHQKK